MTNTFVPSPEIIIKDEQSVENIHWEDCVLLLKIGKEEVQWALYKRDTNYFLRICYYFFKSEEQMVWSERIKELFLKENIQAERCYKVKVIIDTPLYTAIPNELYRKELKHEYLSSLFGENPSWKVRVDTVESKKMKIIYGVPKEFLHYLEAHFNKLSVIHNQSLLLRYIHRGIGDGLAVYATLHPQFTSFIVFSEDKPLLIQPYKTMEPLDVVYHSLNILKQLKLEEKPILYLTGYNKYAHFIKEKVDNAFEDINGIKRPKGCLFPEEMNKYASYYFFHLVYLALCELLAEN